MCFCKAVINAEDSAHDSVASTTPPSISQLPPPPPPPLPVPPRTCSTAFPSLRQDVEAPADSSIWASRKAAAAVTCFEVVV